MKVEKEMLLPALQGSIEAQEKSSEAGKPSGGGRESNTQPDAGSATETHRLPCVHTGQELGECPRPCPPGSGTGRLALASCPENHKECGNLVRVTCSGRDQRTRGPLPLSSFGVTTGPHGLCSIYSFLQACDNTSTQKEAQKLQAVWGRWCKKQTVPPAQGKSQLRHELRGVARTSLELGVKLKF